MTKHKTTMLVLALLLVACGASPLERDARIVQASHAGLSGAATAIEAWAERQADEAERIEATYGSEGMGQVRQILESVRDVRAAHDLARVAHRVYATAALIRAGDAQLDLAHVRHELVETWRATIELADGAVPEVPDALDSAGADTIARVSQMLLVNLWAWIAEEAGLDGPPAWIGGARDDA